MILSKFNKNKTAHKLSHFLIFILPTELSFRFLLNNYSNYTFYNSLFFFFGRMVGCMTSCTCASSILSVSSSNWATPQTPNKPQSSQNSTPCKSVSNLSEKLSICTSLSGKLSIYTSMSGKLNTYTFVSFIFVEHQFFFNFIAKSIHALSNVDESKIFDHYN